MDSQFAQVVWFIAVDDFEQLRALDLASWLDVDEGTDTVYVMNRWTNETQKSIWTKNRTQENTWLITEHVKRKKKTRHRGLYCFRLHVVSLHPVAGLASEIHYEFWQIQERICQQ